MKNIYVTITLILIMAFLLLPLLAVEREGNVNIASSGTSSTLPQSTSELKALEEIKVHISDSKKNVTLKTEEYLIGVLAAEMSADYHEEALKAQALAAYTFAYRKHIENSSNNEYDITNDTTIDQGYLTSAARQEKWGDKAAENEEKIKKAVAVVKNQLITYNNEPILAVYHAISSGNTETAQNVWGTDYPYLKSESSTYDLLSPEYLSEVSLTAEEFTKKITELGGTAEGEAAKYIGENEKSTAGTVLKITICGKEFTGAEIREAFALRSACFDLAFKEGNFIFTVTGYGHGVGMSQFGANYMAQQGSTYNEIISAYYKGVNIVSQSIIT